MSIIHHKKHARDIQNRFPYRVTFSHLTPRVPPSESATLATAILAMPALVFLFLRDPIAVKGSPYKDNKSLRGGSSRGGRLQDAPGAAPGG